MPTLASYHVAASSMARDFQIQVSISLLAQRWFNDVQTTQTKMLCVYIKEVSVASLYTILLSRDLKIITSLSRGYDLAYLVVTG